MQLNEDGTPWGLIKDIGERQQVEYKFDSIRRGDQNIMVTLSVKPPKGCPTDWLHNSFRLNKVTFAMLPSTESKIEYAMTILDLPLRDIETAVEKLGYSSDIYAELPDAPMVQEMLRSAMKC